MTLVGADETGPDVRPSGLRALIQRLFDALRNQPYATQAQIGLPVPEKDAQTSTTTGEGGAAAIITSLLSVLFKGVSSERRAVYDDCEEMSDTVEEVDSGLFTLASNAVSPARAGEDSFKIEWTNPETPEAVTGIADETVRRCQLRDKAFSIIRDALMYGDNFLQLVVTDDLLVSRVMYMPPSTMVRNESEDGLLKEGSEQGEWAFEQYEEDGMKLIAGFYPWQIQHLRWERTGSNKYGRPLMYAARPAWHKLRAMEQALVINWITRAFARLVFSIDVTGLSEREAMLKIQKFKRQLSMTKIDTGTTERESLSVAKDIFIGKAFRDFGGDHKAGLTGVEALDTSSSTFQRLDPIEYYRNKIVMATRVPKAYFGIEEDINAKATLVREDLRFAHTLRSCQSLVTEVVSAAVRLSLLLQGFNPRDYPFSVWWIDPTAADPVERASAYSNTAKGDMVYVKLGVVDAQYIAEKHVGMSSAEWEQVKIRVAAEAAEAEAAARSAAAQGGGGNAVQKRETAAVDVGDTSGDGP